MVLLTLNQMILSLLKLILLEDMEGYVLVYIPIVISWELSPLFLVYFTLFCSFFSIFFLIILSFFCFLESSTMKFLVKGLQRQYIKLLMSMKGLK